MNGKGGNISHAKHCREVLPCLLVYVSVEMTQSPSLLDCLLAVPRLFFPRPISCFRLLGQSAFPLGKRFEGSPALGQGGVQRDSSIRFCNATRILYVFFRIKTVFFRIKTVFFFRIKTVCFFVSKRCFFPYQNGCQSKIMIMLHGSWTLVDRQNRGF